MTARNLQPWLPLGRTPMRAAQPPEAAASRTVQVDGIAMRWEERGSGPPVVVAAA